MIATELPEMRSRTSLSLRATALTSIEGFDGIEDFTEMRRLDFKSTYMRNLTFYIVVFGVGLSSVKADSIVVPSDRETQSGNGSATAGFQFPASIQSVYGARNFTEPVVI